MTTEKLKIKVILIYQVLIMHTFVYRVAKDLFFLRRNRIFLKTIKTNNHVLFRIICERSVFREKVSTCYLITC